MVPGATTGRRSVQTSLPIAPLSLLSCAVYIFIPEISLRWTLLTGRIRKPKQAYPQCLNLRVGGGGTVAPSGGVAGSSLYKRTDPGIMFNLYGSYSSYPYPGPALWTAAN